MGFDPSLFSAVPVLLGGSLEEVRIDTSWCYFVDPRRDVDDVISLNEQLSQHCVGLKSLSLNASSDVVNLVDVIVKRPSSLEKLCIRLNTNSSDRPITFSSTPLHELRALILENVHLQDACELAFFLSTSGGKLEPVVIEWQKGKAAERMAIIDAGMCEGYL